MLLKNTEHRNTGTRSEEVKEDPMTTMRAQDEQRRATTKA
jgi:hypothetical protein